MRKNELFLFVYEENIFSSLMLKDSVTQSIRNVNMFIG